MSSGVGWKREAHGRCLNQKSAFFGDRRAPNPENAGGFITIIARERSDPQIRLQTLAVWEQPRMTQEAFDQRIWKVGWAVAPVNANIPDVLKGYDWREVIRAAVGMAPEGPGSQRVLSIAFVQKGRRMIRIYRKSDDMTREQTLLPGSIQTVCWTYISDRSANRRMDPRVIIYPSRVVELSVC
jgi:hypothetical protein